MCKKEQGYKTKINKLTVSLALIISIVFASSSPIFAIGRYGADLYSAAYAAGVNSFASGSWGECTWYAWGRAYEKTGEKLPCHGDARWWLYECGDYPYDSTPSENSIAVWDFGSYGHVAFVEAVEGNLVYISHGNMQGHAYTEGTLDTNTNIYTDDMGLGMWIMDCAPSGYIHLGPYGDIEIEASTALKESDDYSLEGSKVTVTSDSPCKFGYVDRNGDYVSVSASAVEGEEDTYTYNVPRGITETMLVVKGDIDCDGEVTLNDFNLLKAAIKYGVEFDEEYEFTADVNGDGKVTLADAAKIQAVAQNNSKLSW
ncbi:MAG: CHAP domain-containing protein [Firmicutes bacterium]|nr:CHAP domain-containing protein [Bacillota bacterium]